MCAVPPGKRKDRKPKPNPHECLYHADPTSFLSAMKEVGRTLQIPAPLCKRGAMAVCSCRTSRTSSQRMNVAELRVFLASCEISDAMLLSHLTGGPIQTKADETNLMAIQLVKNALHEASICERESTLRFTALLKMTMKQDLSLLEKEAEIGGSKPVERKPCKRKGAPLYVMIHKIKKRSGGKANVLTLPMFGGNFKRLQLEARVGERFKSISLKYKPCYIEVDYQATGAAMAQKQQKTVVNIWCKKENYEMIRRQLVTEAQILQERITYAHEQQLIRFKMNKRDRYLRDANRRTRVSSSSLARLADPELIKEAKKEDFSRKRRADRQRKAVLMHRKTDSKRKKDGCLKCIHCYNSFTEVHAEHNELTGKPPRSKSIKIPPECRYHPGFPIKKLGKWSCCMQDTHNSSEPSDISTSHRVTGCSIGHSHVWRSRAGRKKNKDKAFNQIIEYTHKKGSFL
ncbi:hypothetical protein ElyMa_001398900 [Elysia marginata]|uniref:Uncharacterized protein n=1 Tax=Elysia marginata TaxID=1093978 RepID=A0AAV4IWY2_9GAST|nr:hypothetical protein ElyMa_001398900 [Elysia marginata]